MPNVCCIYDLDQLKYPAATQTVRLVSNFINIVNASCINIILLVDNTRLVALLHSDSVFTQSKSKDLKYHRQALALISFATNESTTLPKIDNDPMSIFYYVFCTLVKLMTLPQQRKQSTSQQLHNNHRGKFEKYIDYL